MSKKTKKDERKSGAGKKLQKYSKLLLNLEQQKHVTDRQLDNGIHLWYNKDVKRWRWTLLHDDDRLMESGDAEDLDKALLDIRRTIEWVMEAQEE